MLKLSAFSSASASLVRPMLRRYLRIHPDLRSPSVLPHVINFQLHPAGGTGMPPRQPAPYALLARETKPFLSISLNISLNIFKYI